MRDRENYNERRAQVKENKYDEFKILPEYINISVNDGSYGLASERR